MQYATAYMLVEFGRLKAGDDVLITAAASSSVCFLYSPNPPPRLKCSPKKPGGTSSYEESFSELKGS
jgi:hypothetical protein